MKRSNKHTNKLLNKIFIIGLLTVATVPHLFENRYKEFRYIFSGYFPKDFDIELGYPLHYFFLFWVKHN